MNPSFPYDQDLHEAGSRAAEGRCTHHADGDGACTGEAVVSYEDADGTRYLGMIRQPVLVMTGSADVLRSSRDRALGRNLPTAVFTADLFTTGGDAENRAAVRSVAGADLDLVGIALHGPKNAVDKVVKGARMHP